MVIPIHVGITKIDMLESFMKLVQEFPPFSLLKNYHMCHGLLVHESAKEESMDLPQGYSNIHG